MDKVAAVSISQRIAGLRKISRIGAARLRMPSRMPPRAPAWRSTSSTLRKGCIATASAKQNPATAPQATGQPDIATSHGSSAPAMVPPSGPEACLNENTK